MAEELLQGMMDKGLFEVCSAKMGGGRCVHAIDG